MLTDETMSAVILAICLVGSELLPFLNIDSNGFLHTIFVLLQRGLEDKNENQ